MQYRGSKALGPNVRSSEKRHNPYPAPQCGNVKMVARQAFRDLTPSRGSSGKPPQHPPSIGCNENSKWVARAHARIVNVVSSRLRHYASRIPQQRLSDSSHHTGCKIGISESPRGILRPGAKSTRRSKLETVETTLCNEVPIGTMRSAEVNLRNEDLPGGPILELLVLIFGSISIFGHVCADLLSLQ